jgi:hypothetical protein
VEDFTLGLPLATATAASGQEDTEENRALCGLLMAQAPAGVSQPEVVGNGSRHYLDLQWREHGALTSYLHDVTDWHREYMGLKDFHEAPVHLDSHFPLPGMADLIPEHDREGKQAFALAVAFGYVAKQGINTWLYGAETDAQGDLVPKYATTLPTVQSLTEVGSTGRGLKKAPAVEKIGQKRTDAMEAFAQNKEWVEATRNAMDASITEQRGAFVTQMLAYINDLNDRIRPDSRDYDQMQAEQQLLGEFLWDLDPGIHVPGLRRTA